MHIPFGFILIDAARVGLEIHRAKEFNSKNSSLYRGRSEEQLAEVAPYLFALSRQVEFGKWYLENGWGNAWGVLVRTEFAFEELHKHFRKFLLVKTEDGQELYFRYYDPRVLREFLPTCTGRQLNDFFGPVEQFICEDENSGYALVYSLQDHLLKTDRIPKERVMKLLALLTEQK
ncbi:DUF4123 domain-containing protein [Segetibacter sp. 3557_3]|uniref:DUF4123 domain-containing protein n=1 Tax=Segetibacter sp. 3557_3 TaxID=2547429 RepID=UPI001058E4C2|nr:DUF4123 domain-containing protein [Segetibacter sp. 3557_3]TDH18498.1 DUF4123 domain-containing protein [Segetibacter sp. 3557_3]